MLRKLLLTLLIISYLTIIVATVCVCPMNYAPVCGSDGVTYGNECGLHCAQKENLPNLRMLKRGEC